MTWIPAFPEGYRLFTRASSPKWMIDNSARPPQSWLFSIETAYLPRKAILPGDDLAVRFAVRSWGCEEGTFYYLVRFRDAYRGGAVVACTDDLPGREARTATVEGGGVIVVETATPWSAFQSYLDARRCDELTLTVEIEVWVPRRIRMARHRRPYDLLMRESNVGRFQIVTLIANPILLARRPRGACFISYAWDGSPALPPYSHRAWVYSLADTLAHAGVRPVIDYNFLKPATITADVIRRTIETADRAVIVYSQSYLERLTREGTGVHFEYQLFRSDPHLWSRTFPIRRDLGSAIDTLNKYDGRWIMSFEAGELVSQALQLVAAMHLPDV